MKGVEEAAFFFDYNKFMQRGVADKEMSEEEEEDEGEECG